MSRRLTKVAAVVFDMDGTLCLPQTWMFQEMRDGIGLDNANKDILEFIDEMTEEKQKWAHEQLAKVEHKAMQQMAPQPGLNEIMKFLRAKNIPTAICTRNLIIPVNHLCNNFLGDHKFEKIVTRSFLPPKPAPDPLLHIAEELGVKSTEMIMVGDSIDDMRAGRDAGCFTALLKNDVNGKLWGTDVVDIEIDRLDELIELIGNK